MGSSRRSKSAVDKKRAHEGAPQLLSSAHQLFRRLKDVNVKAAMSEERKRPSITRSPLYENLSLPVSEAFCDWDISDASSILGGQGERQKCGRCGRSRMWFCYGCMIPLESLRAVLPKVKLPFRIDIIRHAHEAAGRSTGIHAAILSEDVHIHTYPDIPEYDPCRTVLIFPDGEATFESIRATERQTVCPVCGNLHQAFPYDRIVFVDCCWTQTRRIILDERISALHNRVGLKGRISLFWRPQRTRNPDHLATIEAIHQACSVWLLSQKCQRPHRVDNLLFFFKYMYDKISNRYRESEH
ncbi:DTW domain-containing protein 1 [Galendromus occidentalis]|uniref:tRNA-uridine aminocarboxypropyltransferase 1 n=1 Tax=Galendromus occidentalis TaxID=34638 RepID=A0AAJ7SJM8_9ACAR|nr:DTW domain-containing protein 1 [Galendromus occidentalis]